MIDTPAPAWLERQTQLSLDRLLPRLRAHVATASPADWQAFETRLKTYFPTVFELLVRIYGDQYDFFYHLERILTTAAEMWLARSAELKALDAAREGDNRWFQSQQMLGGVCYVDLFAGNLAGIRARLPYFRELGLTYLHLMPLFKAPMPKNDGGYAVSSYREVNPALGSMAELSALAGELRQQGISLVVDFVFNHTSDEHDWARRALAGEPEYQDYYFMFPTARCPTRTRKPCAKSSPRCDTGASRTGSTPTGPPLGLDYFQQLPVGSELREPRGLPRHAGGNAFVSQRGHRGVAVRRGRVHLEADGDELRESARSPSADPGFQCPGSDRRPGTAFQV